MSEDQFKTITSSSEGFYKEKGSKFISFAIPIQSHEEIKEHLSEFKKTYYDARHICYAYALGIHETAYKGSDDGEPAHTAGDPILGQIRSHELVNVLVVVIRYFGGTKLGVGGLIHAYKTAAADALSNAKIVTKYDSSTLEIYFEYPQTNVVMKLVSDHSLEILEQDFQASCLLKVAVRKSLVEQVSSTLKEQMVDFQLH